jgi:hypothetical protein
MADGFDHVYVATRTSGYLEVKPFNDEPFADHWFEEPPCCHTVRIPQSSSAPLLLIRLEAAVRFHGLNARWTCNAKALVSTTSTSIPAAGCAASPQSTGNSRYDHDCDRGRIDTDRRITRR